jgi:hypothetical protein
MISNVANTVLLENAALQELFADQRVSVLLANMGALLNAIDDAGEWRRIKQYHTPRVPGCSSRNQLQRVGLAVTPGRKFYWQEPQQVLNCPPHRPSLRPGGLPASSGEQDDQTTDRQS